VITYILSKEFKSLLNVLLHVRNILELLLRPVITDLTVRCDANNNIVLIFVFDALRAPSSGVRAVETTVGHVLEFCIT
jgi:hypothetical protein